MAEAASPIQTSAETQEQLQPPLILLPIPNSLSPADTSVLALRETLIGEINDSSRIPKNEALVSTEWDGQTPPKATSIRQLWIPVENPWLPNQTLRVAPGIVDSSGNNKSFVLFTKENIYRTSVLGFIYGIFGSRRLMMRTDDHNRKNEFSACDWSDPNAQIFLKLTERVLKNCLQKPQDKAGSRQKFWPSIVCQLLRSS